MADVETNAAEVDRLRTEVEALKAQNEELGRRAPSPGPPRRGRWRWPVSVVLLVLGGVLLAGSVSAVWAARTVLDTDRYTETVTPLVDQPAIRESLATTAIDRLFTAVDVQTRVREALPPNAAFLAEPISSNLQEVGVTTAEDALASDQFKKLWVQANRRAHQAILPALLGEGTSKLFDVENGTVSVDVSQIVAGVKAALVERGITIVSDVPNDVAGGSYVLFQSDALAQVQSALRALRTLSVALPLLALLVFAGAIGAAPDRRRGALWAGVAVVVSMILLAGVVAFAREQYVSSADRLVLSAPAAAAFFDVIVRFLRTAVRTVAALGLVIMLGAALAGPSRVAVAIRRSSTGGLTSLVQATGLDLGRFSTWVDAHRRALEVVVVLVAGAVLLGVQTPTPGLVGVLALVALLGLVLVELLARAHTGPPTYRGQPSA